MLASAQSGCPWATPSRGLRDPQASPHNCPRLGEEKSTTTQPTFLSQGILPALESDPSAASRCSGALCLHPYILTFILSHFICRQHLSSYKYNGKLKNSNKKWQIGILQAVSLAGLWVSPEWGLVGLVNSPTHLSAGHRHRSQPFPCRPSSCIRNYVP